MVAEIVAIVSLGGSTLGSVWKLYHHLDKRLDQLQTDREVLRSEVRLQEFRISRLEQAVLGEVIK